MVMICDDVVVGDDDDDGIEKQLGR